MVKLDHRHHAFIQRLMTQGPTPEDEAKRAFQGLFQCAEDGFSDFCGAINRELDSVQMEIRGAADQNTGMIFYGLVNKMGDDQAKLGTKYSHSQIAFFTAVMEAILQRNDGQITSMELHSVKPVNVNSTTLNRKATMEELERDKWLIQHDDCSVTLGERAFVEFRALFKHLGVPVCHVCNEAGVKAQLCRNEECQVRLHDYCVPRLFTGRKADHKCPGCKTLWDSRAA